MTKLYLVRHAEAEGNKLRIFQGRLDADISENGERQLERLALRFANVRLDAVYSSPLKRAYKTAQAAGRASGLPIVTVPGLMEIDGGRWEGENWDEIPGLFPEENAAWVNEPWNFAPQGGESMRHVYDRIWDAMLRIARENDGRTVLVASHGCAIRNFACRAKGWPLERLREVDWFENTSVSTFRFENGRFGILELNDVSHLDPEMATLANQSWWQNSEESGVQR